MRPAALAAAWVAAAALAASPATSLAAEPVAAPSTVDRVTLYPDRAVVVRTAEIDLTAGETTVVVSGLPASLEAESLRVGARGPRGLVLGSVETRTVHGRDVAEERRRLLEEQLAERRDEKRALDDQGRALGIELKMIEALAIEAPKPGEGRMSPAAWEQGWRAVGRGAARVLADIQDKEIAAREVQAEIERLERQLAELGRGQRETLETRIQVVAAGRGRVELRLEYVSRGGGWVPAYDLRLDTTAGELTLVQRAEVRQTTGEDWSGVELSLSTAQPALAGRLPELPPWFLDVRPERRRELARRDVAEAPMVEPPEGRMRMEATIEALAALEGTPFTVSYRVPGRVTVPADGSVHRFALDEQRLDVELSARAVPKLAGRAHLLVEGELRGETPLLGGRAQLYQDGSFVGTARLGILRPGASVHLAFGVDPAIEISYQLESERRSSEGVFRRRQRLERLYRIEVANRHGRPLRVTVLDQLPVSRDERIEVELLPATTPVSERDVDGRPGVVAWELELGPQESRTLRFGYAVTHPEGLEGVRGL